MAGPGSINGSSNTLTSQVSHLSEQKQEDSAPHESLQNRPSTAGNRGRLRLRLPRQFRRRSPCAAENPRDDSLNLDRFAEEGCRASEILCEI